MNFFHQLVLDSHGILVEKDTKDFLIERGNNHLGYAT